MTSRRLSLSVALLVGAVALTACADEKRPPVSATNLTFAPTSDCRGSSFDADAADPACFDFGIGAHAHAPPALRFALRGSAAVASGGKAMLEVEVRNASDAPVVIDVDTGCGTFRPIASNAAGASSYETDCFDRCGATSKPMVLHIALEPGGTVVKHVPFFATQKHVVMAQTEKGEECSERAMGPLPPGPYELLIELPWQGDDGEPRILSAPLVVTPPVPGPI